MAEKNRPPYDVPHEIIRYTLIVVAVLSFWIMGSLIMFGDSVHRILQGGRGVSGGPDLIFPTACICFTVALAGLAVVYKPRD